MTTRNDSWRRLAACRRMPTGLFFPDPADPDPAAVADAKAVCAACPVRGQCLTAGIAEEHGIWGGRTPAERKTARPAGRSEAA